MTLDLEAIRKRCEAATPGPWKTTDGYEAAQAGTRYDDLVSILEDSTGEPIIQHIYYDGHHTIMRPSDVQFIAHARTDLPACLDEIERLNARQQELLATIARISQTTPFPDEMKGWESQRAAMLAEIGTLRSELHDSRDQCQRLTMQRDMWKQQSQSLGMLNSNNRKTIENDTTERIAVWLNEFGEFPRAAQAIRDGAWKERL